MFYDGLLLIALWMLATAAVLPLTGGEAVTSGNWIFRGYLLLIAGIFLCGFWWRAGRTLGMQAWRLRVVTMSDGDRPSATQACIRFAAALLSWLPLGLGFLWVLLDRDGLAWHDRLSGTRLIVEPKR